MTDLRLVSTHKRQLKPIVEGALANELRLMQAGLRRTEQRLLEFEEKYHLKTEDFISRYEKDEMEETIDFDEWMRLDMKYIDEWSLWLDVKILFMTAWVGWLGGLATDPPQRNGLRPGEIGSAFHRVKISQGKNSTGHGGAGKGAKKEVFLTNVNG